jgi:hypothetical protein
VLIRAANGTAMNLEITGPPVDNGTYWTFPVTVLEGTVTKGARTQVNFVVAPFTTENAVDAVAAALAEGPGIDIVYNDVANSITVALDTTLAELNTAITDGDVPAALNGVTGVWIGTAAQYAAVSPKVATVVYFVTA